MLFIKTAGPGVEGVEPYTKWLGRISPHFPPMSHSSLALLGIARGPKPASEGGPCASGAGSGRPLWRHPLPHPSCPPPPFSRLERREGKTRFMGEFNCEQDALFLETRASPKRSRRPITGMGTIRLRQLELSPILYFFISQSKWLPKAICDL